MYVCLIQPYGCHMLNKEDLRFEHIRVTDSRGVATGRLGWTCAPHFCQRVFLELMHRSGVFFGGEAVRVLSDTY